MNKKEIIKKVLAELSKEGLLNEKAIKKYIVESKRKLNEDAGGQFASVINTLVDFTKANIKKVTPTGVPPVYTGFSFYKNDNGQFEVAEERKGLRTGITSGIYFSLNPVKNSPDVVKYKLTVMNLGYMSTLGLQRNENDKTNLKTEGIVNSIEQLSDDLKKWFSENNIASRVRAKGE